MNQNQLSYSNMNDVGTLLVREDDSDSRPGMGRILISMDEPPHGKINLSRAQARALRLLLEDLGL